MYTIFYTNTRFYNKATRPCNDSSQAMGEKDIFFSCYATAFQAWHHYKCHRLMSEYIFRKITSGDAPVILAIARRCF